MAPRTTCECGNCRKCKHREYMRRWYTANRDKVCSIAKASRERNGERVREYDRERGYRPGEPTKVRARRILNHAIEKGSLRRLPCEVCGERKTDAHHDDYSHPLEVRWLCRTHHGEVHRQPF